MYHRATPLCPKLTRGQNSVLLGPWPLWSSVELGLFPAQKVPRSKLRPQVFVGQSTESSHVSEDWVGFLGQALP